MRSRPPETTSGPRAALSGPRVTVAVALASLCGCAFPIWARMEPEADATTDMFTETSGSSSASSEATAATGGGDSTGGVETGVETTGDATPSCDPVMISAGTRHTCALLGDASVRCWGYDDGSGRLGYPGETQIGGSAGLELASVGPVALPGALVGAPRLLTAGPQHSCVATDADEVVCWGRDRFVGGGGDAGAPVAPADAPVLTLPGKVISLHAGNEFTCAELSTDAGEEVRCWGVGHRGELGNGGTENVLDIRSAPPPPVLLGETSEVYALAVGAYHACASLEENGAFMMCWGSATESLHGVYYEDEQDAQAVPTPQLVALDGLLGDVFVDQLVAGRRHTCAFDSKERVRCWGAREYLGDNGLYAPELRVPFEADGPAVLVELDGALALPRPLTAGPQHTCVIYDDNSIRCWGDGSHRELGFWVCSGDLDEDCVYGDDEDEPIVVDKSVLCFRHPASYTGPCASTPTQERLRPRALALGERHSCALLERYEDDALRTTVRCWGENQKGELGYPEDGPHAAVDAEDLEFQCDASR
ncbi:MAG: hypothetical protein H6713_01270 [Myxococcales bacterium]|nr:hypothetical protein [Myxococcales bacterium]